MKDFYNISEVAEMFNVTSNKIRFYEEKGIIKPLRDEESGYRKFTKQDIVLLQTVLLYRLMGLSIEDVRDIIQNSSSENYLNHFTKQWSIVNNEIHKLSDIRMSIGKILDSVYQDDEEQFKNNILEIIEDTKMLNELRNSWNDKWNFDNWAEKYDEDVKNDITHLKMYKNYDYLLSKVYDLGKEDIDKNMPILEIGVGTGNLSKKFLENAYNIVGIDQSREMLRKAKEKYPKLKVRTGEFLKIPFQDGYFKCIVSTYAFHHLNNKEKVLALKEMLRVLVNDGKIIIGDIMFKNENDKQGVLKKLSKEQVDEVEDEYFSNIDLLENEVRKAGRSLMYEKIDNLIYIVKII